MLAFFYAIPLVVLLAVVVIAAVIGSAWLRLLAVVFQGSGGAAAASGIALLGVLALLELSFRMAQRYRRPSLLSDLRVLGRSTRVPRNEVGGAASALAQVAALGIRTPATLVALSALGAQLQSAASASKDAYRASRLLPGSARRRLARFLVGCRGASVVVRPSFVFEDQKASYAGVFPSVRADSRDIDAVVRAMLKVLDARDAEAARDYRRRLGLVTPLSHALILQVEPEAELRGTARSRGVRGRGDQAVVDVARRRSPARTMLFDYVDGEAKPLVAGAGAVETPGWLRQIAWVALLVEETIGAPAQVEFAVVDGSLRVAGARPLAKVDLRTFTCSWPVGIGSRRDPALFHDLRGGLETQRLAIAGALAQAGFSAGVEPDEVRYFEGVPYVDVAVLRRAVAQIARALLLGSGIGRFAGLLAPVLPRRLPTLVEPASVGLVAWREVTLWQQKQYVRVVRRYFALGTRGALLRAARRLLLGGAGKEPIGHPLVRWLVDRRTRSVLGEVAAVERYMLETEARIGDIAKTVLTQGAGGWDQMFAGDRHVHLDIEMVAAWFGDAQARAALDAKWRQRKAALAQREDQPPPLRVFVPAIGEHDVPPSGLSELRGIGLVPGSVSGRAILIAPSRRDVAVPEGAVVIIADGATEDARIVLDAGGLVFLGGGACSAVALVAEELGVPTIACPDVRPGSIPTGGQIFLDADSGMVRF